MSSTQDYDKSEQHSKLTLRGLQACRSKTKTYYSVPPQPALQGLIRIIRVTRVIRLAMVKRWVPPQSALLGLSEMLMLGLLGEIRFSG